MNLIALWWAMMPVVSEAAPAYAVPVAGTGYEERKHEWDREAMAPTEE